MTSSSLSFENPFIYFSMKKRDPFKILQNVLAFKAGSTTVQYCSKENHFCSWRKSREGDLYAKKRI